MAVIFIEQPIVVGDTIDFQLTAKKNGLTWDITGGTVTLYLIDPDGTITPHNATLTTPASGIADYVTVTTDLNAAGDWFYQWKVAVGSIVMWSEKTPFEVKRAAA